MLVGKLTMWMRRWFATLSACICVPFAALAQAGAPAAPAAAAAPLAIGSVSEVDTNQVQDLIERASGAVEAPVPEQPPLVLTLAEAIDVALLDVTIQTELRERPPCFSHGPWMPIDSGDRGAGPGRKRPRGSCRSRPAAEVQDRFRSRHPRSE